MKKKPSAKLKKVKAFAVLHKNGSIMMGSSLSIFLDGGRASAVRVMQEAKYIVPCTITYKIPKPN